MKLKEILGNIQEKHNNILLETFSSLAELEDFLRPNSVNNTKKYT